MKSEHIGKRLSDWRKSLGLTQEKFAEQISMQIGVYRKYEQGKNIPGGEALAAIASTGININWLLSGEGLMNQPPVENLDDLTPADMEVFHRDFKHIFEMLDKVDAEKRETILTEMLSRLKEAVRIQEMEEKLKALEARDK